MAHNPHTPQPHQGPQDHDPAGSTQMFQAFVNDDSTARRSTPTATQGAGSRTGLIAGVVVAAVVVIAAVAWLALG
ncbi:hypothetical protein [Streptomyces radicis]|uniref:Uncharacterized protein n=1 Tax=Streptomyces radicis TaxID=1750517 RepID=A0A3A9W374_9ACTN|nr:hypothetical protein [Streptomyces radicis]RKN07202.1 hypothetical protein D7319_19145 [Streptomyces radicis]RKN26780.1 hypothetical protein D7318_05405 [Streptomyces radicis]